MESLGKLYNHELNSSTDLYSKFSSPISSKIIQKPFQGSEDFSSTSETSEENRVSTNPSSTFTSSNGQGKESNFGSLGSSHSVPEHERRFEEVLNPITSAVLGYRFTPQDFKESYDRSARGKEESCKEESCGAEVATVVKGTVLGNPKDLLARLKGYNWTALRLARKLEGEPSWDVFKRSWAGGGGPYPSLTPASNYITGDNEDEPGEQDMGEEDGYWAISSNWSYSWSKAKKFHEMMSPSLILRNDLEEDSLEQWIELAEGEEEDEEQEEEEEEEEVCVLNYSDLNETESEDRSEEMMAGEEENQRDIRGRVILYKTKNYDDFNCQGRQSESKESESDDYPSLNSLQSSSENESGRLKEQGSGEEGGREIEENEGTSEAELSSHTEAFPISAIEAFAKAMGYCDAELYPGVWLKIYRERQKFGDVY